MLRPYYLPILVGLIALFATCPGSGFDEPVSSAPPVAAGELKGGDRQSAGGLARSGSLAGAEALIKRGSPMDVDSVSKPAVIGGVAKGGSPQETGGEYRGDARGANKSADSATAGGQAKGASGRGEEGFTKEGDPSAVGGVDKR
jgi:hypothetical protein